jgi:Na+/phosphate symporter
VLIMDWVNRAVVYVPRHDDDPALAGLAHAVAETLVEQSQKLSPPAALRDLHPHFVLVLENTERAFYYLAQGDEQRADRHLAVVHDETRMMRQIQREIGIDIPELAL